MTTSTAISTGTRGPTSPLARLRDLIPLHGHLTFDQALRIAELQAAILHRLLADPSGEGVTETALAQMPRLRVVRESLTVSGTSHWNGREWVICLNETDSLARQRFTLLHEFAHVMWHGHTSRLFRGDHRSSSAAQAEMAADYFAGCVLLPKRLLKRAWGDGLQRPDILADHFGVSRHAVVVRLAQTGLDRVADHEPTPRCARSATTPVGQLQRFRAAHDSRRSLA